MPAYANSATPPLSGAGHLQQRQEAYSELDLLRMTLNQVDYGLVVVEVDTGTVQFANALGRDALEYTGDVRNTRRYDTGLCLLHGRVVARRPVDSEILHRTLQRTRAGLRGLLSLGTGTGAQTSAVAVVPLSSPQISRDASPPFGAPAPDLPPCHALLVFAKQQLCDDSTMALFARERGLTSAEGQVLAQVCRGMRPSQIADRHGVQISTVRTQLRSIRMKTCSETIRELVQKVSVLPPMALHLSTHRTIFA